MKTISNKGLVRQATMVMVNLGWNYKKGQKIDCFSGSVKFFLTGKGSMHLTTSLFASSIPFHYSARPRFKRIYSTVRTVQKLQPRVDVNSAQLDPKAGLTLKDAGATSKLHHNNMLHDQEWEVHSCCRPNEAHEVCKRESCIHLCISFSTATPLHPKPATTQKYRTP